MTERLTPNPYSPYANADPDLRHLIPAFLGLTPSAGVLTLAACGRMAVVREGTLGDATDALMQGRTADLPPGLCPVCITVATGQGAPGGGDPDSCRECGDPSSQGEWCALCRQEMHDAWWPTREAVAPNA